MLIKILDSASLGADTPLEVLNDLGEVLVYERSDAEELLDRVKDADVIILNKIKITRAVIDRAENLKLICVFATGYDNVDLDAARRFGIAVCNVPGYSTDSVAQFTVATVLSLIFSASAACSYVISSISHKRQISRFCWPRTH